MTAWTSVTSGAGEEIVSVHVEDGDPFAALTLGRHTVALTRDECRRIADALRAASRRNPPRWAP
jgi:enoyl-CoA hydratase/carnithine racemase